MQNKVGDKESPCFTPLVVSNQSVYRKFSPQNRGLSRKKVVFRPPAWIKWERLMYHLLIFFHESSQIEEMPQKKTCAFVLCGGRHLDFCQFRCHCRQNMLCMHIYTHLTAKHACQ